MRKKDDKLMQRIVECFDALYQKEALYNNQNIAGIKGIPEKYLLKIEK